MKINGIAASNGIAIAKAFKLIDPDLGVTKKTISDIEAEIALYEEAIHRAVIDLEKIKSGAATHLGEEEAAVFDAHISMVRDPELTSQTLDKVKSEALSAAYAFDEVTNQFIMMFEGMDNEYFRERAADIKDVKKRVLAHLLGVTMNDLSIIDEEVIVVAEDLTPSDTAQLNRRFAKGFATNIGGRTSHSAIMARSLEIPAVVGTKNILEHVQNGDLLILDGFAGLVIVNPSGEQITHYEEVAKQYETQKAEWAKLKGATTVTKDGHHVELAANIGTPEDVVGVLANGAEGIGLYRTEFLYMGRNSLPTEEEQFKAYQTVLKAMKGQPVIVRTLDIGGDKELPYLQLQKELNPFLGYRAIRLCLDDKSLFRTQLRALLRASNYGKLRIMFPMIATLDEFRDAKALLLEEKAKLIAEGHVVSEDLQVGMMVEIPSAAILADQFAKEVDFFSIGTNDLIQYTMAADRMNEKVSYLYQPYHPSILRLIKMVIDASHKENKWTGMCGEMAGDVAAIPLLLGLGLDEFSMSATSILPARSLINKLSKHEMQQLACAALTKSTVEEVTQLVENIKS